MTNAPLIVCFSGRIGSGKSSVTEALAKAFDWPRAGFGDYLRSRIIEGGGDPSSRQALQDLGQSLVESDPDAFCMAVLESGGYRQGVYFLLDGIRHVDIFRRVARLVAPSRVRLIHLDADHAHIRERVAKRSDDTSDLERAEGHRVEADLTESLPSIADMVIDANQPLPDVLKACIACLASFDVPDTLIESAQKSLADLRAS